MEVRNHDCWGAPALGMLGPPATALQGSFRHQPEQQHASNRACSWCKAEDHVIKECPLNAYLDEHMEGSSEQEAGLAQHAGIHVSLHNVGVRLYGLDGQTSAVVRQHTLSMLVAAQ